MVLLDVIIFIIIGGFVLFGLWFGLVHTLGSFLGMIVGAYLASRYYAGLGDWLVSVTGWTDNVARVLMFIFAFIIINRLVGFFFWIVDKSTTIFTSLPFIKGINKFLGMFLGFFEGVITIGLILYFIEAYPLSDTITEALAGSILAPFTVNVAAVLLPLLPEALRILHDTVDAVEEILL